MQLGPNCLARANDLRARIDSAMAAVTQQDNHPGVDDDAAPGEVSIANAAMQGRGQAAIIIPRDRTWKDEVETARVSFDPKSGAVQHGKVDCEEYYDSSYGRSAADVYHYQVDHQTEGGKDLLIYRQLKNDYYSTNNTDERVTVDAATNKTVDYRGKEYAMTFGQGVKRMVTTPSGLFLTGVTGLLFGAPGTLTGTFIGPVAGFVAAGALIAGMAYYNTRPWGGSHLPKPGT